LATAKSKVSALEKQLESFEVKLEIAGKKLVLDQEVAESEHKSALQAKASVEATVERLRPYVKSGAVTELEFDAVANQLMAAESKCIATKNQIRQVEFSQTAAKSKILILGDRIDDEMGRIKMDLEIAKAEHRELEIVTALFAKRVSELDVVAPRDGTVFVTYRQVGEYLKIADEAIALSYPGKTWAAGQVTSSQASRVRPGQPVVVSVPSIDVRLKGVVSAVGHRAMYSHGRYNAEFRGTTATDVPIKVIIENLPEDIPSGIRLDMAINTGFGIQWLDETMGYKLEPIGGDSKVPDSTKVPVTVASEKSESTAPSRTPVASTSPVGLDQLLPRR
ncbi:MAG: HlyD family secretion protein, partial [Mariniblastus sp.]